MEESGFKFLNNIDDREFVHKTILPVINGKYCLTDEVVVVFCRQGWLKLNLGFRDYTVVKDSLIAIGTNIPFYKIDSSEDVRTDIICMTQSVLERTTQGMIKIYFTKILYEYPLLDLHEEKGMMAHNIHSYLRNLVKSQEKNIFKKQIIRDFLNVLFYEVCNIVVRKESIDSERYNRNNEIVREFIFLVEKSGGIRKKVELYAAELNLSPKYLSLLVKEATGRVCSDWIDDYTVLEAKSRLKMTDCIVQNISYDLGFATPSHFTKFFKDRTGMTPKEYRKHFFTEASANEL